MIRMFTGFGAFLGYIGPWMITEFVPAHQICGVQSHEKPPTPSQAFNPKPSAPDSLSRTGCDIYVGDCQNWGPFLGL